MAIEGPLRELGIHDVFQLLDLSRKTGALRVTSELRDDEGDVLFDGGRVVHASIKSNPTSIERVLRQSGRITAQDLAVAAAVDGGSGMGIGDRLVLARIITQRELERQLKQAIENVIFELMSWHEGFFSFEERSVADVVVDARIRISTESLLMEGARRIDEWSRIADKVPSLGVVAALAPVDDDRASMVDLLPHEWEVLMMIDGVRDLREIAGSIGASEFDVARTVYGLITTGVVEVTAPERAVRASVAMISEGEDFTRARLEVARALTRESKYQEAVEELRRAVQADPLTPEVHLDLGYAAVRVGDFANARASWEHFLRLAPSSPDVSRVREAIEALGRLLHVVEAHTNG
jgi:tetratricopeptide (TPR) repeat protein